MASPMRRRYSWRATRCRGRHNAAERAGHRGLHGGDVVHFDDALGRLHGPNPLQREAVRSRRSRGRSGRRPAAAGPAGLVAAASSRSRRTPAEAAPPPLTTIVTGVRAERISAALTT